MTKKMLLAWAKFVPLNYFFVILSYLLSPLLAAISLPFGTKLPGVLQWFSTSDDDLNGGFHQGVDGYEDDKKLSIPKRFWQRTCWICRNPANGFQTFLMGKTVEGFKILEQSKKEGGVSGDQWKLFIMENKDGKFFAYKTDLPLFGKYYLKLWIGWNNNSYDGTMHQYCASFGFKKRKQ